MTPEQFVYWLQGFLELGQPGQLGPGQLQIVRDHLATVFTKGTPPSSPPAPFYSPGKFPDQPHRDVIICKGHTKIC